VITEEPASEGEKPSGSAWFIPVSGLSWPVRSDTQMAEVEAMLRNKFVHRPDGTLWTADFGGEFRTKVLEVRLPSDDRIYLEVPGDPSQIPPHWLRRSRVSVLMQLIFDWMSARQPSWMRPRQLGGRAAAGLTALAVVLAGRRRPALRDEWRAHLAGYSGHDPITWPKIIEAFGFVASAIRCRCSDAAEATWTPVDAVLKSRTLSNIFVLFPTMADAAFISYHDGLDEVLRSMESIAKVGAILYGLVLAGRWYRNLKPPQPKRRRSAE
jgi:hypothetical protein